MSFPRSQHEVAPKAQTSVFQSRAKHGSGEGKLKSVLSQRTNKKSEGPTKNRSPNFWILYSNAIPQNHRKNKLLQARGLPGSHVM